MFDFVEEAFNLMALFVNKPIALARLASVAARRNDGLHVSRHDDLDERIAVIALVTDKRPRALWGQRQQRFGLPNVAGLPTGQHEFEGVPQGVGDCMNLGAKPALRSPQGFVFCVTTRSASGAGMGAVDGGVYKHALQIRKMDASGE